MNLRSPAGTKIVGALALVLVAALGWLFVLSPAFGELDDVHTRTSETEANSDVLTQQLTVLKEQQQTLPQIGAASAALAVRFPATADQPGLFEAVSQAVADAGIPAESLTALTPTPPVVGNGDEAEGMVLPTEEVPGNLGTQIVTVSVESTYDQARQLLANLEKMPRAYLVTSLTVTAIEGSQQFSTTIVGDMFVMPVAAMPDAAVLEPVADTSG